MNNTNNSEINKKRVTVEADTGFAGYKGTRGDLLHRTVLPIIAMSNNNVIPLGTGFMITNGGMLITARHVIEDFIDKKEIRDFNEPVKNFGLFAIYESDIKNDCTNLSPDCYVGGPLRIIKIYANTNLDIALCQLQLMKKIDTGEQLQCPLVRLNFSIPKKGEKILGVGYCKSEVLQYKYIKKDKQKIKFLDYSHNFITTGGEIVEYTESQGIRKFPTFQTTARFDPGMSGGPVFRENGSVFGVICSSQSNYVDKDGYISWVSDIGPALDYKLDILLEGKKEPQKFSLFELIKMNIIGADDSKNKIKIFADKTGKSFAIRPII
ncbi:MAG: serine protease [Cyanobacteria bacterium]|nr:serine protease [Cyanobacteriota bacterium]